MSSLLEAAKIAAGWNCEGCTNETEKYPDVCQACGRFELRAAIRATEEAQGKCRHFAVTLTKLGAVTMAPAETPYCPQCGKELRHD